MTAGWSIEPMRVGDLPLVLAIDRRSFARPWSLPAYLRELRNPRAERLVARTASAAVSAFAIGWVVVDELEVMTVAVDAHVRGHGLGRELVRRLMASAAARGARTARLEVRAGNRAARHLYARLGFRRAGRRTRYYGNDGEDALLLERPLDGGRPEGVITEGYGGDRLR